MWGFERLSYGMAILISQKFVRNLGNRPHCHARESGHPDFIENPGFRLALAIASLAGMTSESFKRFQEQPPRSITVRKLATLIVLLFLLLAVPSGLHAQSLSLAERQKIEALIRQVGELKDAQFVRNGSTYEVSTAMRFLRGKWAVNESTVKTARDFIEKVASFSGTSGKPYLIRFKDGKEIPSREFLAAELQKIETAPTDRRASDS